MTLAITFALATIALILAAGLVGQATVAVEARLQRPHRDPAGR